VYGLSIDPINDNVFASACDDGRVLIYDIREPPSTGRLVLNAVRFVNYSRKAYSVMLCHCIKLVG
jgi:WD repeat-containing protein 22